MCWEYAKKWLVTQLDHKLSSKISLKAIGRSVCSISLLPIIGSPTTLTRASLQTITSLILANNMSSTIVLDLIILISSCLVLDIYWYNATFTGMKLAGIILIGAGFMVVLFPSNWPDGIHRLIRYGDCRHR